MSRAYYLGVGVIWLSHIIPIMTYIFLGFTLALLGELSVASLLPIPILMHGVCLGLLLNILEQRRHRSRLVKVFLVIDEVLLAPKLIRAFTSILTGHIDLVEILFGEIGRN